MTGEDLGGNEAARIPKEEWDSYVARVTKEMKEFTKKFAHP
jgi:hypothetical protein